MFRTKPFAVLIAVTVVLAGCTDEAEPDTSASASPSTSDAVADTGLVDVGGYELAYQCAGDRTDALVKGAFAKGIYLRDRSTEPGCAGSLRIAAGIVDHTRQAIAAIEEVLCGGQ